MPEDGEDFEEHGRRLEKIADFLAGKADDFSIQARKASAAMRSVSRRVPARGPLKAAIESLPEIRMPPTYQFIDPADIEDVFDAGLRHKMGVKPTDYLTKWLGMFRNFSYATKDDSWGELEKEIMIVLRNYVRLISGVNRAREALRLLDARGDGK